MRTLSQQLDGVMIEISNRLMDKLPLLPARLLAEIDMVQIRLNDKVLEGMTIAEVRKLLRVLEGGG